MKQNMSTKIQQRFRIPDGIGVVDGQHFAGSESERERERVDGEEAVLTAGDIGIIFQVPIITIPGLAHYGGGPAQGFDKLNRM
jgi:hypothetical protein